MTFHLGTVYHSFRLWQTIHDAIRDETRQAAGREASPSAASIDAESAKTVEQPATCRGCDGGKRVNGRTRHLAVDTLGLLLVVVTAANVVDSTRARLVAGGLMDRVAQLVTLFADASYHSQRLTDCLRSLGAGRSRSCAASPIGMKCASSRNAGSSSGRLVG